MFECIEFVVQIGGNMHIEIIVQGCKHCGERHSMEAHRLADPVETKGRQWNYIVVCPITGEPILTSIEVVKEPDENPPNDDEMYGGSVGGGKSGRLFRDFLKADEMKVALDPVESASSIISSTLKHQEDHDNNAEGCKDLIEYDPRVKRVSCRNPQCSWYQWTSVS